MPRSTPLPAVTCFGEAMAVLTPVGEVPLAHADRFTRTAGGAEFNVALTLARFGVPTAWVSRLGDDGFGEHVLDVARGHGVDVSGVEVDPDRPTGLYVKAPGTAADGSRRSRMHYYRNGSAASAMTPELLTAPAVAALLTGSRTVHVSGITPGLSASAGRTCDALADLLRPRDTVLSVDLNHRPALWRDLDDGPLHRLLDAADEVLLGEDEAVRVLGTGTAAGVRAALPRARRILLKAEERGVLVLEPGRPDLHVPALRVDVVEPVGAGDAFAAGYLAGRHTGLPVPDAVLLGHRCAAATLVVRGDQPEHLPELVA
ncbi:sugar kinase [Kineococcus sp. SYSU DK001]|uniref:sugar kinase n=1 Tax=Kineococcus sp. SYSU DK001 TaxID=3383122 RepID=UPI003D7D048E